MAEVAATQSTTPLDVVAAISKKMRARPSAATTSSLIDAMFHPRKSSSSSSVSRSNFALETTAVVLRPETAVLSKSTTPEVVLEVVAVGVLVAEVAADFFTASATLASNQATCPRHAPKLGLDYLRIFMRIVHLHRYMRGSEGAYSHMQFLGLEGAFGPCLQI